MSQANLSSHQVLPDPILSKPGVDSRECVRLVAEAQLNTLATMVDELTRMLHNAPEISATQTMAFREVQGLYAQARYLLGLARK